VNVGLQGPVAGGVNPFNFTLPLAIYKSANGNKTGFMGTGIIYNSDKNTGFSIADYAATLGYLHIASSLSVAVAQHVNLGLSRVGGKTKTFGSAHLALFGGETPKSTMLRSAKNYMMYIAELPLEFALNASKLTLSDMRMPWISGNRVHMANFAIKSLFVGILGAGIATALYTSLQNLGTGLNKEAVKDTNNWQKIAFGAVIGFGTPVVLGLINRSLHNIIEDKVDKLYRNISPNPHPTTGASKSVVSTPSVFESDRFKAVGKFINTASEGIANFTSKMMETKGGQWMKRWGAQGAVAAGIAYFLTDPMVGYINATIAYGELDPARKEASDTYSGNIARRGMTVLGYGLAVGLSFAMSGFGVTPAQHVERFAARLDKIAGLEEKLGDNLTTKKLKGFSKFIKQAQLTFELFRLRGEAGIVSTILEQQMHGVPRAKDPNYEYLKAVEQETIPVLKEVNNSTYLGDTDPLEYKLTAANNHTQRKNLGTKLAAIKDAVSISSYLNKNMGTKITLIKGVRTFVVGAALSLSAAGLDVMFKTFNNGNDRTDSKYRDWYSILEAKGPQQGTAKDLYQGFIESIKLVTQTDTEANYAVPKGLITPSNSSAGGVYLMNPNNMRKNAIIASRSQHIWITGTLQIPGTPEVGAGA